MVSEWWSLGGGVVVMYGGGVVVMYGGGDDRWRWGGGGCRAGRQ